MRILQLSTITFFAVALSTSALLAQEESVDGSASARVEEPASPEDATARSSSQTAEEPGENPKENSSSDEASPTEPGEANADETESEDGLPTEEQPAEEQPAEEQPAEEQTAEEQPAEEEPAEEPEAAPAPAIPYEEEEIPEKPKRSLFIVTYNMALPIGSTRDFVEKFSFEGVGFEYRFRIRPDISVGALFAWNTFEERETGSFEFGTMTLTGKRARLMDAMPLHATFHYNFVKEGRKVIPFAGLNLGAMYVSRIIDYAWWFEKDTSWHFALAPEVGVMLHNLPVPLYIGVKYNWAARSGDFPANSYINFNLGISWSR